MKMFFRKNRKGFTLIELMIVMSIIGILASIAAPNFKWGLIKARESVLRENLYTLRSTLDQYYADNKKYPDSLDELIKPEKQYLRQIPIDPFTRKADWVTAQSSQPAEGGETAGGVSDVHSASPLIGINGEAYNSW